LKRVLLGFSLLVFGFSLCEGQSWVWAKAAVNDTGWLDPYDLTTDTAGNIYETGLFNGKVTIGTQVLNTISPNFDAFIIKYDNNGNAIWAISPVVTGQAYGISIATNDSGNVCVTGYYTGSLRIGTFNFPNSSNTNLFIAEFSSSGILKWASYSQSNSFAYIQPYSVTIDKSFNTYVTGQFDDSVSFGSIKINGYGFFLEKIDNTGNVIWVNTANVDNSYGNTVVTDATGNIYVAGEFSDSLTIDSKTITTKGVNDVFLAKFTPSGNLTWITSAVLPSSNSSAYYTTGLTGGKYMCIDNIGNLYLTGFFSDTIQFGTHAFKNIYPAVFLAKYSPSGIVLWANESSEENIPNSYYYKSYSISCNKNESFYICGTFSDSIRFNSVKLTSDSIYPSFLFKFDSAGNVICGSEINNYNDDNNSVAVDPLSNNVFFSGDIEMENGCYFGSNLLTGTNEYGFLAKWTCETLGINELSNKFIPLSLFPNPNTGAFTLEVKSEEVRAKSVEVYNVMGQKVFTATPSLLPQSGGGVSFSYNLNISSQPNGVYLYRVIDETGKLLGEGKFVIEK